MSSQGSNNFSGGSAEKPHGQPPAHRARQIRSLLAQVIDRRARGENLPDEAVIAAHADLMPQLGAELAAMRDIHRACLAAQKSGFAPRSPAAAPEPKQTAPTLTAPASASPGHPVTQVTIHGYTILHEINAGGQGTVFKATQQSTGRTVAIKVIPGGPFVGARQRARFDREAEILASLDHPTIVRIIDRGRTPEGSLYMAMDYIEGWSLDEYISGCRRHDPIDIDRLVRLFAQIALGVSEAHAHGIVHRDLKPSNLRIDKRGEPHILDFGLARLTSRSLTHESHFRSITLTGQIVGSLPWASPEQVSGEVENLDTRSDVYSLGVLLYQALTGTFPYRVAGMVPEVMANILHTVPLPPSQIWRPGPQSIPPSLDAIVLKALAKSPDQRYATAEQLAEDLHRYLTGQPALAAHLRPAVRRLLRPAAITISMALCLIAALGLYRVYYPNPPVVAQLPTYTNSIGMRLVRIKPGRFIMGSDANERGRNPDEKPHPVQLSRGHYIGITEVTQRQYLAVMGRFPADQPYLGHDLPVHKVTWSEAIEFCQRLSQKEGKLYRLPTEAEWEYACKGGTGGPFAGSGSLETMGWYKDNSDLRLHRVATRWPNHWGIYDMHGNVREWCLDGYESTYPADGAVNPLQPMTSRLPVVRGGSYLSPMEKCRSASRSSLSMGIHLMAAAHPEATFRSIDVGFRVLLEINSREPETRPSEKKTFFP